VGREMSDTFHDLMEGAQAYVVGNFNGPMDEVAGAPAFGFAVAVPPSYLQVVRIDGRYVLRDGYHRAFAVLSRGISCVPAFVRAFDTVESLAPVGRLPHAAWPGERPPLLLDYHDNAVAETLYYHQRTR
jgi:hypothetical protein